MSNDPIKNLWQSQQLNLSVDEILAQAKARQKRMFWLMLSDVIVWIVIVFFFCLQIKANKYPESFALGFFVIVISSFMVGYALWVRSMTWGMDSLDAKNALLLSIRRCEAGIQMGWVGFIFCVVVSVGLVVFSLVYPESFGGKKIFAVLWAVGWSVITYGGAVWYRNRQNKKITQYQGILEQLNAEKIGEELVDEEN